jgi:hypothetical protein
VENYYSYLTLQKENISAIRKRETMAVNNKVVMGKEIKVLIIIRIN